MATAEVGHEGIVVSVAPDKTCVRIVSSAACASCHAAGLCTVAERQDKIIEVTTPAGASYKEGDTVRVVLSESKGLKAAMLSYGVPVLLVMASVIVCTVFKAGELFAGLGAGAAVALYYFLLWLMRKKIGGEYHFSIKE